MVVWEILRSLVVSIRQRWQDRRAGAEGFVDTTRRRTSWGLPEPEAPKKPVVTVHRRLQIRRRA